MENKLRKPAALLGNAYKVLFPVAAVERRTPDDLHFNSHSLSVENSGRVSQFHHLTLFALHAFTAT